VRDGLDDLNWAGKQALIRTIVRRVEIDRNHVEVVFRVPPPAPETSKPLEPPSDKGTWHHCTDDQHLHCGTSRPLGASTSSKPVCEAAFRIAQGSTKYSYQWSKYSIT
jgi:site-specific DNA recombinase